MRVLFIAKCFKLVIELGIEPVRLVELITRDVNAVDDPRVVGIVPIIGLLPTLRLVIFTRYPILVGIVPLKDSLLRLILVTALFVHPTPLHKHTLLVGAKLMQLHPLGFKAVAKSHIACSNNKLVNTMFSKLHWRNCYLEASRTQKVWWWHSHSLDWRLQNSTLTYIWWGYSS